MPLRDPSPDAAGWGPLFAKTWVAEQLPELARFAEEVGFHGITLADHLVMPTKRTSRYPYTEDGEIF